MAKLILGKVEHGAEARYELRSVEGNAAGKARHRLALAWVDPIVGKLGDAPFSLEPYTAKDLLLPVGAPMAIVELGAQVGLVRAATVADQARLGGADFFRLELAGRIFDAYLVGFGRKGSWLCLYEQLQGAEKLVAQIGVPTKVRNWLPSYTLYAVDDWAMKAAVFLTLYYGYFKEEHWLDRTSGAVRHQVKITTNKKMKARFDPGFNERVEGLH